MVDYNYEALKEKLIFENNNFNVESFFLRNTKESLSETGATILITPKQTIMTHNFYGMGLHEEMAELLYKIINNDSNFKFINCLKPEENDLYIAMWQNILREKGYISMRLAVVGSFGTVTIAIPDSIIREQYTSLEKISILMNEVSAKNKIILTVIANNTVIDFADYRKTYNNMLEAAYTHVTDMKVADEVIIGTAHDENLKRN